MGECADDVVSFYAFNGEERYAHRLYHLVNVRDLLGKFGGHFWAVAFINGGKLVAKGGRFGIKRHRHVGWAVFFHQFFEGVERAADGVGVQALGGLHGDRQGVKIAEHIIRAVHQDKRRLVGVDVIGIK